MPKESIGHALHALNSKTHRFIDTYLHKRENDQLTGANTWVIHFIAEHRGSPVYLRDVERHFGVTRSTASKVVDCSCARALWSATSGKPIRACAA